MSQRPSHEPLGPQCWACRRRRVRCDSGLPCIKCTKKGISCPGYDSSKPWRWRHAVFERIHDTGMGWQQAREDDVASVSMVRDAIVYYNTLIAPSVTAYNDAALYSINVAEWLALGIVTRHLYVCVVSLHRTVLRHAHNLLHEYGKRSHHLLKGSLFASNKDEDMVTFYQHHASAARQLNNHIMTSSSQADLILTFDTIATFMASEIQLSACGSWRSHLNGAKSMLRSSLHSGADIPVQFGHFPCFQFMVTDIFGTSTCPSQSLTCEAMAYHSTYLDWIGKLDVDARRSLTPIPDELLRNIVMVNLGRAAWRNNVESATEMDKALTLIHHFQPNIWVEKGIGTLQSMHLGWTLLTSAFKAAAMLYAILNIDPTVSFCLSTRQAWDHVRAQAYLDLTNAIDELFERRLKHDTHYKFVLWPLVIAGMESIVRGDDASTTRTTIHRLITMTADLGTVAMYDAAMILSRIGQANLGKDAWRGRDSWDKVFHGSPIYIM